MTTAMQTTVTTVKTEAHRLRLHTGGGRLGGLRRVRTRLVLRQQQNMVYRGKTGKGRGVRVAFDKR